MIKGGRERERRIEEEKEKEKEKREEGKYDFIIINIPAALLSAERSQVHCAYALITLRLQRFNFQ